MGWLQRLIPINLGYHQADPAYIVNMLANEAAATVVQYSQHRGLLITPRSPINEQR